MKSSKRMVRNTVMVCLVVLIAVVIYVYYNDIFKVEGEARLADIMLPGETHDLISSIDEVKMDKLDWKDVLIIRGWVFNRNAVGNRKDIYLVLKSQSKTMIFDIEKDKVSRPDVTTFYKLDEKLVNHGFEVYVPRHLLKETKFQVGFVLSDNTGNYFTMSPKELLVADGVVTVKEIESESETPKTNQVNRKLKPPVNELKCGFETIVVSDSMLIIGGWGFLDGSNANNMNVFILLKRNDVVRIFSIDKTIRKDVSTVYKETKLDLDSSGFMTKIPISNLEKGHYQVGLYIERGEKVGMSYPKYIDIP